MSEAAGTALPTYHRSFDWDAFYADYPEPDVFERTVYRWSADRLRALQDERFLKAIRAAAGNRFYRNLWAGASVDINEIRSLDDIGKLPVYTTEAIKDDQQQHPPFGLNAGFPSLADHLARVPTKLQSSGGTTGKPRLTLHGVREWEVMALGAARSAYIQGVRPGDVMQIPATCSLANLGWAFYKAAHDYLGVLPLTTGSGVVTPSRKQLELAFDCGTNVWMSFPEYLIRLADACRDELGRDIRELNTKLITTFLGPDTEGTLRRELEDLWGCPVYDNYGTNEIGEGAFECQHQCGLHWSEDLMFFEILDTETNRPVEDGQVGNLVVTVFHRTVQPAIRFNLRDLGRLVASDKCACGSSFRRMDHFLGRSDNMLRIRGVNVYPMACLAAVKSDPRTAGEWLCEAVERDVDGRPREALIVHVETRRESGGLDGLREHLESRLREDLGLTVEVRLVDQGALAGDASLGEGKARRAIDRRPQFQTAPSPS
jgi:phenylacetate-CoA ligase